MVGGFAVLLAPGNKFSICRMRTRMTIRKRHTSKPGIQRNVFYQLHARREPSAEGNQSSGRRSQHRIYGRLHSENDQRSHPELSKQTFKNSYLERERVTLLLPVVHQLIDNNAQHCRGQRIDYQCVQISQRNHGPWYSLCHSPTYGRL